MRAGTACLALALVFCGVGGLHGQSGPDRVQLTLDVSEAEQVLAILALHDAGKPVSEVEWQKLFATEPYRRLKQREQRRYRDPLAFTDSAFKEFVLSDSLRPHAAELRRTLAQWQRTDLRRSAGRVLVYLPDSATIRAKVYPVIKPRTNSFVFEPTTDPAIFLYLDPAVTAGKFENTVAHELHHIGLASLGPVYDRALAGLPEHARAAAEWMGAFGEGLAMLAAAGGPDIDPHAASTPQERALWQKELAGFDSDLPRVDDFLLDVLHGRLDQDSTEARASAFFGAHQGAWYTVGYRMAVLVEGHYGRPALIRTMTDFRCLLTLYNRAAALENHAQATQLPLWSGELLAGVRATTCGLIPAAGP